MRRACAAALLAGLAMAAPSAQQPSLPPRDTPQAPPQGTASIAGRVVQLDTGLPLRRVQVSARRDRTELSAVTDAQGRYTFTGLAAGSYRLSAARGGFVTLEYGQRRPLEPGRPVELADGQKLDNLNFSLPRGSAISGRVVDDAGEPLTGATVQVHRYRYVNGQRQLTVAGSGYPTDDYGRFRVFGLMPGDYYVSAGPPGDMFGAIAALAASGGAGIGSMSIPMPGTASDYIRTYYPNTPWPAAAQRITLGVGEESAPLTLQLVAGKTATVTGTVFDVNGQPSMASVMARPRGSDPLAAITSGLMATAQQGSFRLTGLVPGEYTLDAVVMDPFSKPMRMAFATTDITVNGDMTDVVLTATAGVTARGRIVFEGGVPDGVRPGQVQLSAPSPQASLAGARPTIRDDWTFELEGLSGPRVIRATPPPSWYLERILRSGQDITDRPVDFTETVEDLTIVFTRTATTLSGLVTDTRGTATSDYVVLVYAEDPERRVPGSRFIRTARPAQDGRYQIVGLPPGRYFAAAVVYLEPGEELDPDRLQSLTRTATRLELRQGESRALDLRLLE